MLARVGAESDEADPGRMKIKVMVGVGDGDAVLRVGAKVAVDVDKGNAAAVRVAAAFAVCTMKVLIAPGSVVGNGVPTEGAHARIRISAISHKNRFCLRIRMFESRSFYNNRDIWIAQLTFHNPCHYMESVAVRCFRVKIEHKRLAGFQLGHFNGALSR